VTCVGCPARRCPVLPERPPVSRSYLFALIHHCQLPPDEARACPLPTGKRGTQSCVSRASVTTLRQLILCTPPLGRNTGPAWPGVIPAPSESDPLRFHHLLLHGRPHGRYCGRRSRVHHKDADAATHSAGQSALRSPHLREPLRSIHQHRLLPWDSRSPAPPLCWNTGPARPGVLPSSCTDSSWAPPALEPHHYNGRPNEAPRCLPQLARAHHRSGHYMDGRRKPHANACPGLAHGKPLATQPPGTTPSTACCLKIEGACRILSLLGPGPLDRESAPHGVRLRPVIAGSTKLDVLPRRDAQPSTGHLP
jgi:hypothetical protein